MISIDRSLLPGDLDPLVFTADPTDSLYVATYRPPVFDFRKRHAPDSDDVGGAVLQTAVLDISAIPLTIYARGTSWDDVEDAMAEANEALSQFIYALTLEVGGVDLTYNAECSRPAWTWDEGMVAACMAVGPVTIPVNPPGA